MNGPTRFIGNDHSGNENTSPASINHNGPFTPQHHTSSQPPSESNSRIDSRLFRGQVIQPPPLYSDGFASLLFVDNSQTVDRLKSQTPPPSLSYRPFASIALPHPRSSSTPPVDHLNLNRSPHASAGSKQQQMLENEFESLYLETSATKAPAFSPRDFSDHRDFRNGRNPNGPPPPQLQQHSPVKVQGSRTMPPLYEPSGLLQSSEFQSHPQSAFPGLFAIFHLFPIYQQISPTFTHLLPSLWTFVPRQ